MLVKRQYTYCDPIQIFLLILHSEKVSLVKRLIKNEKICETRLPSLKKTLPLQHQKYLLLRDIDFCSVYNLLI